MLEVFIHLYGNGRFVSVQIQHVQNHSRVSDEQVMVIKRSDLFVEADWQGILKTGIEPYIERIKSAHTFLPRSLMEQDPHYKQIIPYLIFIYENRYFLMQRQSHASEQRLRNKMSMGIGGHLRQEDIQGGDFFAWAQREFNEEVDYAGGLSINVLGLINDDSNAVGQVHVGLVMVLTGSNSYISVKSELKSGSLVSLDECFQHYDSLESWSQIVVDALRDLV